LINFKFKFIINLFIIKKILQLFFISILDDKHKASKVHWNFMEKVRETAGKMIERKPQKSEDGAK
jgi:hypothetical protein